MPQHKVYNLPFLLIWPPCCQLAQVPWTQPRYHNLRSNVASNVKLLAVALSPSLFPHCRWMVQRPISPHSKAYFQAPAAELSPALHTVSAHRRQPAWRKRVTPSCFSCSAQHCCTNSGQQKSGYQSAFHATPVSSCMTLGSFSEVLPDHH